MKRGPSVSRCLIAAIATLALFAAPVLAQMPPPLDLPSQPRREIPLPDEQPSPALELPGEPPEPAPIELEVTLRRIRIEGNSVLSNEVLGEIVRPYLSRALRGADLERLRHELTLAYVDRGYVTSGVLLPDQDLAEGLLVLRVYEGRIARVQVEGNEHLRAGYVRARVAPDPAAPVEVARLEQRLQLLQQDPLIATVHARLEPGDALGESVLTVRIEESQRLGGELDLSNDRSPAIGATNAHMLVGLRDLTGFGDGLQAGVRVSAGLRDVRGLWGMPVTSRDTRVEVRGRWAKSEIVEQPFADLDISSDFTSAGIALGHPVYRSIRDEVRLGLLAEWRRGRNFVDDVGFSFAEGADRGQAIVAPLRFVQDWTRRGRGQVIALRSILSLGLPILGATDVPGAEADALFVSWIAQGQWAQRFDGLNGSELFARGNLQLASEPLLPIEQFSLGGHASVRGYRENQLVTDGGFDASLEIRLPVWRRADGRTIVQLASFADVGRGWSDPDRSDGPLQTLASVGLGLRVFPTRWLSGEMYWGHRLIDVPNPESDPQDDGIYFRVSAASW